MEKTSLKFAQLRSADNVEYTLRDKDGNIKPLFQENSFAKALLKSGKLSPSWINQPYAKVIAPFLGHYADSKVIGNLVTTVGFAGSAGRLMGSGAPAAFTWIALGTGATAAAITDTTLQTELSTLGLARVSGTVSLVTTTGSNDTAQVTNTFSVTGTAAVTESGILNAASVGTLLTHQVFSAINVINGDSLAVTWKVQMH